MTSDAATVQETMSKKKPPPPAPPLAEPEQPSSETVRIDRELLEMARYICFHRRTAAGKRLKLTQYLHDLLSGPIAADYATERTRQGQPLPPSDTTKED